MKIWALVSQKGGSGKSTLATQLAAYACELGETTIIVDLDPQGSSKSWHVVRGEGQSPSVVKTPENKINDVMKAIRETKAFSLVIIDTPPHSNKVADMAIKLADLVICPTRPSNFDLEALRDTSKLIDLSDALGRSLVVLNCAPAGAAAAAKVRKQIAEHADKLGMATAPTFISDRKVFVTAINKGKGVTELKDAKATKEIVGLWTDMVSNWPKAVKVKQGAKSK